MLPRRLAWTLLVGACSEEAPSRPVSPPSPFVAVAIPALSSTPCDLRAQPTHRLAFTGDGVTLDGGPLAGPSISDVIPTLRALAPSDREVTLAIDAELALDDLRPLLTSLAEVDGLRLYVSHTVGEDPRIRHLPIGTPRLHRPWQTASELPANSILHEITPHARVGRPDGPTDLHRFDPQRHQLLAYGERIRWGEAVRGLASICGGAILIDPPRTPPGSERPRDPHVTHGTPRVTDASDGTDADPRVRINVRVIVQTRHADLDGCYTQALARDRDTRGRVTLAFTIGDVGAVVSATAYANTTGDDALGACLAAAARRWQFLAPPGGRAVSVVFPFDLSAR